MSNFLGFSIFHTIPWVYVPSENYLRVIQKHVWNSISLLGKLSVEGKIDHKFDMKPHSETLEDYGKFCRERTNKSMTKTRQIQVKVSPSFKNQWPTSARYNFFHEIIIVFGIWFLKLVPCDNPSFHSAGYR